MSKTTSMLNTSSGMNTATASKLSVLIPVYNEVHTIVSLVEKVKSAEINIEKEILIVDDGSTDGTRDLLNEMRGDPELKIEFMDENVGRGGVIKHLWPAGGDEEVKLREMGRGRPPFCETSVTQHSGQREHGEVEDRDGPSRADHPQSQDNSHHDGHDRQDTGSP